MLYANNHAVELSASVIGTVVQGKVIVCQLLWVHSDDSVINNLQGITMSIPYCKNTLLYFSKSWDIDS